jgi:hypothetical protein
MATACVGRYAEAPASKAARTSAILTSQITMSGHHVGPVPAHLPRAFADGEGESGNDE